MPLLALGLNHQTAPVALRERVAVADADLGRALAALRAMPGVEEAAVLSTCNRTEIYARVADVADDTVGRWLAEHHGVDAHRLEPYLYRHHDAAAVRHLFRVATGLDSLVLGEPQILGQVKQAWAAARDAHALKTPLDRLFQQCFTVSKRVRTDTRIGAHPVSVAYAAVRLAQQVFARLDQATVLLVGAGDTIELAARHLVDARVRRLLVANRTLEHAQTLAQRFGGYALPLADLDRHLAEADIVISATASRDPVLTSAQVGQALAARRRRPMFLLDLAVPRDIETGVAALDDVYLYTVDDLDRVIEDNRRSRREAADQAEAIIELQVGHYMAWWQARDRNDALKRLRAQGEAQRVEALAVARDRMAQGQDPQAVMEWLAHRLTSRLLHAPSAALRDAALRGDTDLLRAAERLYDLDDKDDDDARPAA
ncbi:glutamyl-tRNA reductase [Coralloluteibacterium stylophorae]|uniref:Glutamyl-tRNA reductase n=1 Tax=Coralloluteibacterium stylophorae TaxID=1776034 RepID=A0A8J7VV66_9GAMM|nr:glutamyl-tRNA reductase [Coralloluteibacterium stylophorae]MBS7456623.1 glutamyl-tRNA reductase [Coralloluteibacterium stylophorae]